MEDQAYLEPDFDPNSLTIPRIRSILVAHNINYPSSAKKAQLIELFNEHVKPQAGKLRAASLRVKRTSRGIVDVASNGSAEYEEDEDVAPPPPPPSTGRKHRMSSRARTEEPYEVLQSARSTRHSTAPPEATPRRSSSKHLRADESAEDRDVGEVRHVAARKSRSSLATPAVRGRGTDDDSPFSSENVFQSGGSSPPAPIYDPTRRRTTSSATREAERRRSDVLRRRTQDAPVSRAQVDGAAAAPTRRTFEMPVSIIKKERQEIEPSEEFTPEEEQALVQAQREGAVVPARRRATRSTGAARTGVSAVAMAFLAGVATLWGQEKFQVGYCGVGHNSREIAGIEIPEWADVVRPKCEPCPMHALCEDRLQTICEPGFILVHHPLSLGGQLPLPPTCEPDSATARKVESVKQKAIEELREQNAEYECNKAPTPEVKESVLKARIASKRRKGMTNEEFEALWDTALPEIRKVDEVNEGSDGASGEFTLRSRSLARVPLGCAIRRSIRTTLREYIWSLIAATTTALAGIYMRYYITSGRRDEARAQQLARVALEKLSLQATLHARDPSTYRETYLPVAQLRDDVLRDEFSSMTRQKLWARVQRKVEHNANVRLMVREGRSGDVGRVWEWIGAVGMLEPGSSASSPPPPPTTASRPRVSFGGERRFEPSSDIDSSGLEMSQMSTTSSRWKESGQYY